MRTVTYAEIASARERIAPYIHKTPVMTSAGIDRLCGARVFFNCENFQRTGSFKFRGAMNAVASLSAAARRSGVVTHSSGNHGQALARAAREFGIPVYVVVPNDAPQAKIDAIRDYGGEVILCEPTQSGREETAEEVRERTGAIPIDSHDDPRVIAGQGTATIELIEETGPLDMILVPVGGGGLISGTAIAAGEISPKAEVIGCEPVGAAALLRRALPTAKKRIGLVLGGGTSPRKRSAAFSSKRTRVSPDDGSAERNEADKRGLSVPGIHGRVYPVKGGI